MRTGVCSCHLVRLNYSGKGLRQSLGYAKMNRLPQGPTVSWTFQIVLLLLLQRRSLTRGSARQHLMSDSWL